MTGRSTLGDRGGRIKRFIRGLLSGEITRREIERRERSAIVRALNDPRFPSARAPLNVRRQGQLKRRMKKEKKKLQQQKAQWKVREGRPRKRTREQRVSERRVIFARG